MVKKGPVKVSCFAENKRCEIQCDLLEKKKNMFFLGSKERP